MSCVTWHHSPGAACDPWSPVPWPGSTNTPRNVSNMEWSPSTSEHHADKRTTTAVTDTQTTSANTLSRLKNLAVLWNQGGQLGVVNFLQWDAHYPAHDFIYIWPHFVSSPIKTFLNLKLVEECFLFCFSWLVGIWEKGGGGIPHLNAMRDFVMSYVL